MSNVAAGLNYLQSKIFMMAGFFLIGPLAFYAPKGTWIVLAIIVLNRWNILFENIRERKFSFILPYVIFFILPIYALTTTLWAIEPQTTAFSSLRLVLIITIAILSIVSVSKFSGSEKETAFLSTSCGFVAAEAAVFADFTTGGLLSSLAGHEPLVANLFSRGAVMAALIVLPVSVGLARCHKWKFLALFLVINTITILALDSESAKFGLGISVVVFLLVKQLSVLARPVFIVIMITVISVPFLFVTPLSNSHLCAIQDVKQSAAHRLAIWNFVSRQVLEKPILGWGMDSSRAIPGGSEKVPLTRCIDAETGAVKTSIGDLIPLHPHNASLQIWLELGGIGVLIALITFAELLRRSRAIIAKSDIAPTAVGVFSACFTVYHISYGVWQNWLLFFCIILLVLMSFVEKRTRE